MMKRLIVLMGLMAALPAHGQGRTNMAGPGIFGVLDTTHGGTGTSAANLAALKTYLGVGASGGSVTSVTSVTGSGGTTGLTLTGGPITGTGTLTLGGTLAVANGGTGAITAALARTALGLAIGADVAAYSDTARLSVANTYTGKQRVSNGTAYADLRTGGLDSDDGVGGGVLTFLNGGTEWDASVLISAPSVKLTTGAAAGKVWTSTDTTGAGTWATPTSGATLAANTFTGTQTVGNVGGDTMALTATGLSGSNFSGGGTGTITMNGSGGFAFSTGGGGLSMTTGGSTAATVFSGTVTAPQIKQTTGAANGSVLVSDAAGLASWSNAVSGSDITGGTFGAVNGSALTGLTAANLTGTIPVGVLGTTLAPQFQSLGVGVAATTAANKSFLTVQAGSSQANADKHFLVNDKSGVELFSVSTNSTNVANTFTISTLSVSSAAGVGVAPSNSVGQLYVNSLLDTRVAVVARGNSATATANLLSAQTSAGAEVFGVTPKGHVLTTGTIPTVGSGAITTGSTDTAGSVTFTAATSIAITFATAYVATPKAVALTFGATPGTTGCWVSSLSTTGFTVNTTASYTGAIYYAVVG